MGILGRINSVIKSNVNAVLDKMTDPAKEIDLLLEDMRASLKKATEEAISCAASAKRTAMRCGELEREREQWQRRAEQAVRVGDDGLARQALERQLSVQAELERSRRAVEEEELYVDQLKESLKGLEARIQEVSARKETIKAKARAAKEGRSGVSGGKAFEDFHRLEDRIEAIEAESDLTSDLEGRDAAVEAKFARLEGGDPQVEDALAELKRKVAGKE